MRRACTPLFLSHSLSIVPCQRPSELSSLSLHLCPCQSPPRDQDSKVNPVPLDSNPHMTLFISFSDYRAHSSPDIKTLSRSNLSKISKLKFFSKALLCLHFLGETSTLRQLKLNMSRIQFWYLTTPLFLL